MIINSYGTKTFENIFRPDVEEPTINDYYDYFKTWYLASGLSDGNDDVPAKKTFVLIFNEYCDCHVAYSEDDFKRHFANELYTYFKEFEATTTAIDELMALNDADIENMDSSILNIANIPETTQDTDTESVDFISQQQKTINKKGTLQVKKELLANKKVYTVHTFLKRFKILFRKILSPTYTQLYREEEED